jgi:hypothetical protein
MTGTTQLKIAKKAMVRHKIVVQDEAEVDESYT